MKFDYIQELLIISIFLSTISCAFIQKTKSLFKSNKYIVIYSLIVNIVFCIIFCYSFSDIKLPGCLWAGLFSFIGADTLYKTLEGRLSTYTQIITRSKS